MFSYVPMSKHEALEERYSLLKEGEYDAVINSSIDKTSSTGNPMMDITVKVFDENGKDHDIRDFLVFTKKMMWKVIHCAESAGVLKEYEEGDFCSDLVLLKRVKVRVTIEEGGLIPEDKLNGKSFGAKYPNKNRIEDYITISNEEVHINKDNKQNVLDDDIPF